MAKQGPKDVNTLAFDIVNELTGDDPPVREPEKDPAAVVRGKKGGTVRAEKLQPEKKTAIAKKGANARWGKKS